MALNEHSVPSSTEETSTEVLHAGSRLSGQCAAETRMQRVEDQALVRFPVCFYGMIGFVLGTFWSIMVVVSISFNATSEYGNVKAIKTVDPKFLFVLSVAVWLIARATTRETNHLAMRFLHNTVGTKKVIDVLVIVTP